MIHHTHALVAVLETCLLAFRNIAHQNLPVHCRHSIADALKVCRPALVAQ